MTEPRFDPNNYHYALEPAISSEKGVTFTVKEYYISPKGPDVQVLTEDATVDHRNFTQMRLVGDLKTEDSALNLLNKLRLEREYWCRLQLKYAGMVL